jgi:hypothetical protein
MICPGMRFERLLVLFRVENDRHKQARFLTVCDCGREHVLNGSSLLSGRTRSCGCLKREVTAQRLRARCLKHGMTGTAEWRAYCKAKQRCNNPHDKKYPRYGGRGIRFLFSSFQQFFSELGPRPSPEYSVDRRDNDGNYEPGNVRWATRKQQSDNQQKVGRFAKKPPVRVTSPVALSQRLA